MKILRRYSLIELMTPFLMSLVVFTFIFLVGSMLRIADLLVNKGVSIWDLIEIISFLIPKLLSFTLPTAALTSILLVYGSFAQNNEILAMKAAGVNIARVMLPVLVVAFIISLFMLVLNDQILPKAQFAYRKAVKEVVLKKPTAYLEEGRFIKDFKGYIILINKIRGNDIEGITIYQPQDNRQTRTIIAERGYIETTPDEKHIIIKLFNGTSDEPGTEKPDEFYKLDFKTFEMPPLSLSESDDVINKKVKDLTIDEIVERMDKRNPALSRDRHLMKELKTEFHKKISFSFSVLFLAMVGLPLAIITRRGEAVISFSLAMLVITFYYICFVLMKTLAIRTPIPPGILLWLPNVIMAVVAYYLIKRVTRS